MPSLCLASLPLMIVEHAHPAVSLLFGTYRPDCFGDKKLSRMSLQCCLTPCELAQANQFSPVKSAWTSFFPWLHSSESSVEFPLPSLKGSPAFCRERIIPSVEGRPLPSGGRDTPHCLLYGSILSFPHLTLLVFMYLLFGKS